MTQGFKDLVVWQKAKLLVSEIYLQTQQFPKEEMYGLTSQIRRAAVSIPTNLAEGYGRDGYAQFAHYISIAFGSACELENLLLIAVDLKFLEQTKASIILNNLENVQKMLQKLRESQRRKTA